MPSRKCANCQQLKEGVKLCADDLLCPDCSDENDRLLREQRKNSAASHEPTAAAASAPAEATGRLRGSKPKQLKKAQQSETLHVPVAIDGNTATIAGANSIDKAAGFGPCCDCQKQCPALSDRIEQLYATVAQQQQIIQTLSSRLNFVLSFLDIHHSSAELPEAAAASTGQQATVATTSTLPRTFVDVLQQSIEAFAQSQPRVNVDKNSAVTAMYVEQNNKARRANSFVVSGLPSSDSTEADNDLVQRLCQEEFNLSVDVKSSKRIGKPVADKPRRLLVYVRSQNQAQTIIQSARRLRQSKDTFVQANVFISANLTKAEAKAQFEIRQQRRASNHNTSIQRGSGTSHTPPHSAMHGSKSTIPSASLLSGRQDKQC
jgi:hypothetical protein